MELTSADKEAVGRSSKPENPLSHEAYRIERPCQQAARERICLVPSAYVG